MYRSLTSAEIAQLELQGCSAANWTEIEVAEAFDAQYVHNTRFSGRNRLGAFHREITLPGGLKIHAGIYNATLHNCEVGDDAHLYNIHNYIANYRIGRDTCIENVNAILVDGKTTLTAAEYAAEDENEADEPSALRGSKAAVGKEGGASSAPPDEKKGYFYSRRVLDPEVLAKEDTEGQYEGVTFTVEVLGEDGEPLDRDLAAARSLRQPKRERKDADGETMEEEPEEEDEPPVSVTYETNGNVNPHRIIVRLAGESEAEEGFAINISRSGKATVGDDEEEDRNVRRRRRR